MTERKPPYDFDTEQITQQIKLSFDRDKIRDAVLDLYRAQLPDDQYDPADDHRQEDAVKKIIHLTGSPVIAEAIQQALNVIIGENILKSIPDSSQEQIWLSKPEFFMSRDEGGQ